MTGCALPAHARQGRVFSISRWFKAQAGKIFAGQSLTTEDDRRDYGEVRYMTVGLLEQRMVVIIWTHREPAIRVISMRKANDREYAIYSGRLVGH